MAWTMRNFIATILNLALAIALFFLGLRFAFELFGANSATPFVAWIYNTSAFFLGPFAGILPNIALGGNSFIDVVAIVAMIAYSLIVYLVIAALDAVITPASTLEPHSHYR